MYGVNIANGYDPIENVAGLVPCNNACPGVKVLLVAEDVTIYCRCCRAAVCDYALLHSQQLM
jgi:hypothetical protein